MPRIQDSETPDRCIAHPGVVVIDIDLDNTPEEAPHGCLSVFVGVQVKLVKIACAHACLFVIRTISIGYLNTDI